MSQTKATTCERCGDYDDNCVFTIEDQWECPQCASLNAYHPIDDDQDGEDEDGDEDTETVEAGALEVTTERYELTSTHRTTFTALKVAGDVDDEALEALREAADEKGGHIVCPEALRDYETVSIEAALESVGADYEIDGEDDQDEDEDDDDDDDRDVATDGGRDEPLDEIGKERAAIRDALPNDINVLSWCGSEQWVSLVNRDAPTEYSNAGEEIVIIDWDLEDGYAVSTATGSEGSGGGWELDDAPLEHSIPTRNAAVELAVTQFREAGTNTDGGQDSADSETETLDELAATLGQSGLDTEIAEPETVPRTLWLHVPASYDSPMTVTEDRLPEWATIIGINWSVSKYNPDGNPDLGTGRVQRDEPQLQLGIQDRRDRQCPDAYVQEIAAAIREGGAPAQGIDQWATDELGLTGQEWGDMTDRDKTTVLRNARRARGDE